MGLLIIVNVLGCTWIYLNIPRNLGIWQGQQYNQNLPWLRWWDSDGNLLLTGDERAEQEKQRAEQEKQRAEQEKQRAEQEKQRAEQEKQRADRLAAKLRELGIDAEEITDV